MKLSIITINYNNVNGLRKTMESVFVQTCKDFEYIVVDGASTDGSVDVIREFDSLNAERSTLNAFTWVNEKDTGIYNAMNKGVRMAKGEYVLMLNSGDYFVNKCVVERILSELDGTDIVQGNTIMEFNQNKYRCRGYGKSDISFLEAQQGQFLHQAAFCKKTLFDQYGYFDESYRYVADTIFFLKTIAFGDAIFRYVDIDVAHFDTSGVSYSVDTKIRVAHSEESARMRKELFPGRASMGLRELESKMKVYDQLHSHKWAWLLTMAIKSICDRIYGHPEVFVMECIK